jgi:uncharacterized protein
MSEHDGGQDSGQDGEQANVARVRRIYDAFVTGDVGHIVEQVTDDVHWVSHVDPVVPSGGDWSGRANVAGFFAAIGGNVDITSFEPADFVAQGDTVVSTGRFGGTARPTGRAIDSEWVMIYRFADGRLASWDQFHDGALAAAFR